MNLKATLLGYIAQVEIIHRKGKPEYYKNLRRLYAIDRLQALKKQASVSPPNRLAHFILKNENDLRIVLPHHTNKDYQTTLNKLETLFANARFMIMGQEAGFKSSDNQIKMKLL